jgi:hypothetical protein
MIRRFNRFELKYLIQSAQLPALVDDIKSQMTRDPHGGESGYRVTSLYYDSADLRCYWAKRDGIKYRRKLRVRVYGESAEARQPVMVEIKQRINRTVQKRRVCLPLDEAYALCDGHPVDKPADPLDRAVLSEVELLVRLLVLQPACVISYLRQPWIGGPYDRGLRVTFDAQLSCRGPESGLAAGQPAHHFIPPDWFVLEIKADDKVPLWVTRMVSRHGLQLKRMSKYCAGLALLRGLDRATELPAMGTVDADRSQPAEMKIRSA